MSGGTGTAQIEGLPGTAGLGRPIKGPSALGSDPRRLWHLTWTLARTEFKLTFFGSVLGYAWQLMRPLLLFGVIYIVLLHFAETHSTASAPAGAAQHSSLFFSGEHLAAALLLGIVLFTFLGESCGTAVTALVNRENLVRKIDFPRLAVPLSTVLTAMFNLALNMAVVLLFLLAEGASAYRSWLEVPLLVLALAAFSTGLSMLLSVAYVRYRDIKPIWDVAMQANFYASGIFIPITKLRPIHLFGAKISLSHVLMANPFAAILEQARHAFMGSSYPTAAHALGGGAMILVPIGIALAVIVAGFLIFDRQAPYVAERL
ncbi:MAG: ABC transporter permease [Acidobacteriota bacterium]|nr:ABC transporter permease [Acidobacteriota bacterium]